MCGIGGFWGRFDPELLARMNDSMAHRGPDDTGVYVDGDRNVGLAHRRLSIIDPDPRGAQPMWDATESVCIVYNGELYNYRELKAGLRRDGYEFRTETDTEVLLNLYRRDGSEMLGALNGMFAFALWAPDRNRMLVARDGLGIKPLYLAQTDRGVVFASELKALLQEPEIGRELDPAAVRQYATFLWAPAPKTPLEGVEKIEPGEAVELQDGAIERRWYHYDLPYAGSKLESGEDEAIDRVREGVREAVRRQLVADVPVGAFLSGGLDSSSIVAMYRELRPDQDIECFTIDFESDDEGWQGVAEDLPYARQVAEYLDVDLSVVTVGPDMVERLGEMIFHLDEPQGDLAPLNAMFISELARDQGIKVLLSGAGGDDVFTGYRRHLALQLERYWSWLPAAVRRGLEKVARTVPVESPRLRQFSEAFQFAGRGPDERLFSYFYWLPQSQIGSLLSDEFRAEAGAASVARPLRRSLERLPEGVSRLDRMLYLEAKHFLADHNLNYTDKVSMSAGVEVRVPLLDPDLVELATSLPDGYKQRGTHGKWVLKQAMKPSLPSEVLERPKTGFGVPLRQWLRNQLAPVKRELLSKSSLRSRGVFEPDRVHELMEADRRGEVDAAYVILQLMSFELWCRMFVDPRRPKQVDVSAL